MRLPYTDNPPKFADAEDQAIVDRITERRTVSGEGLLPLDRALLIAPKVADGWNSFLGAVRTKASIPDSVRQVAIARTVSVQRACFAWPAHKKLLLASSDTKITNVAVDYIVNAEVKSAHATSPGGGLEEKHLAIIAYADYMTKDVKVPDAIFDRLRPHFGPQDIVEITAAICAYNCTTRFLWALDVGEGNDKPFPPS